MENNFLAILPCDGPAPSTLADSPRLGSRWLVDPLDRGFAGRGRPSGAGYPAAVEAGRTADQYPQEPLRPRPTPVGPHREGWHEIVDRLIVSALIEARSCERFGVLADHSADPELAALYQGLWASEYGHYQVFLQMAEQLDGRDTVTQRWDTMLDAEATIIQAQPPGPRIHSGLA